MWGCRCQDIRIEALIPDSKCNDCENKQDFCQNCCTNTKVCDLCKGKVLYTHFEKQVSTKTVEAAERLNDISTDSISSKCTSSISTQSNIIEHLRKQLKREFPKLARAYIDNLINKMSLQEDHLNLESSDSDNLSSSMSQFDVFKETEPYLPPPSTENKMLKNTDNGEKCKFHKNTAKEISVCSESQVTQLIKDYNLPNILHLRRVLQATDSELTLNIENIEDVSFPDLENRVKNNKLTFVKKIKNHNFKETNCDTRIFKKSKEIASKNFNKKSSTHSIEHLAEDDHAASTEPHFYVSTPVKIVSYFRNPDTNLSDVEANKASLNTTTILADTEKYFAKTGGHRQSNKEIQKPIQVCEQNDYKDSGSKKPIEIDKFIQKSTNHRKNECTKNIPDSINWITEEELNRDEQLSINDLVSFPRETSDLTSTNIGDKTGQKKRKNKTKVDRNNYEATKKHLTKIKKQDKDCQCNKKIMQTIPVMQKNAWRASFVPPNTRSEHSTHVLLVHETQSDENLNLNILDKNQTSDPIIPRNPLICPISDCLKCIFVSDYIRHISVCHHKVPLLRVRPNEYRNIFIDPKVNDFSVNKCQCLFLLMNKIQNFGTTEYKDYVPILLMSTKTTIEDLLCEQNKEDENVDSLEKHKEYLAVWLTGLVPENVLINYCITAFSKYSKTPECFIVSSDLLYSIRAQQNIRSLYKYGQLILISQSQCNLLTDNGKNMIEFQVILY